MAVSTGSEQFGQRGGVILFSIARTHMCATGTNQVFLFVNLPLVSASTSARELRSKLFMLMKSKELK